jgi:DNA polymerase III delta prime subunit
LAAAVLRDDWGRLRLDARRVRKGRGRWRGRDAFVLRVLEQRADDARPANGPWAAVGVERIPLERPFNTYEFLRLRAVPPEIAAQFKGTVAQGRHLQELPDGTAKRILEAAAAEELAPHLRQYTLVEAGSADEATAKMEAAGRSLQPGDRAFVASPGGLLGVHDVTTGGALSAVGHPIPKTPDELLELFEQAALRVKDSDRLAPARAIAAIKEIKSLLDGPEEVLAIDDFGRFYDGYHLLANKINQALEIAKRPLAGPPPPPVEEDDETGIEFDELAALQGLDIDLVRKELPDYMVLPDSVLEEAVTALRAGKHLLLSGPPGTGKSTVAEALCRAVVQGQYEVATGTADWTTFDTIGGYMPTENGLEFAPGIVLRCLQRGRWLVIDELNRADIDKAFGPLFTLLAGTGQDQPNRRAILPYQRDGKNIEIRWAEKRVGAKGDFVLTPGWRLLGTLNVSDKASLFQLSFAFLRRFAVVDVPLPPREGYATFFGDALGRRCSGRGSRQDGLGSDRARVRAPPARSGDSSRRRTVRADRLCRDECRRADIRRPDRRLRHGSASLCRAAVRRRRGERNRGVHENPPGHVANAPG